MGWEEGRNQQPPTQLEPVLGGVNSPSVVAPPRMMAGCARQSHLLVGFAKQGGARRVEGGGTPVQTTSRRGPTCSHSSTSPGRRSDQLRSDQDGGSGGHRLGQGRKQVREKATGDLLVFVFVKIPLKLSLFFVIVKAKVF